MAQRVYDRDPRRAPGRIGAGAQRRTETDDERFGGQGRGDCEDYVIAKYFTLRHIGISPDRLRLVYVRARAGTGDAVAAQAHMVLAYYAQPDAEPLVLDNLISDIRTASRRPDLVPVYSFNNEGVFSGSPGVPDVKIGGIGRLSRWEDLLRRARAEGFE